MVLAFKTKPRKRRETKRLYETRENKERYYGYIPPSVLKIKSYLRRTVRELWGQRYSIDELKRNPDKIFEDITRKIEELITQEEYRELVILSPFLHKRYVREFIRKIQELRKKYGKLEVVVVTRPAKNVAWGRNEHNESIMLLKEAGITVCYPSKYAEKFHAKAIILDTEIVIAGSINYLAPSHDEIAITIPLIKILSNPISAKTIARIFRDIRCLKQ